MTDPNEVLVVGAGPVGLIMAAELHRHGVPCRLVERMPETLLLYSNHPDLDVDLRRFQEVADALRDRYGGLIRTYAIFHADGAATSLEGMTVLTDGCQEFARLYGPQRGSAYLVRPDGYLGYRAQSIELEPVRDHLRGIFGS